MSALVARLGERQAEIEGAVLARVYGVSDSASAADPEYRDGLRKAVSASVAHGIAGLVSDSAAARPPPAQLLSQARLAAEREVAQHVVLRRCAAGYMLLGDFLLQVWQEDPDLADSSCLRRAWRNLTTLSGKVLAAVAEEYCTVRVGGSNDMEQRRAARVHRLLAGDLVESTDLDYELDAWHLGAIVVGPGAKAAMREIARAIDRRLLVVPARNGEIWAWFGGQRKIDVAEALRVAARVCSPSLALSLGEPGEGIAGWRLSHRQAKAAIPIALRGSSTLVRYADVALLATALADDVLADSLRRSYLLPLETEGDEGPVLRRALSAYFAAGRNVSSAAAALGASRRTVANRLALAEKRIGRPLDACAADLETALCLWELEPAAQFRQ